MEFISYGTVMASSMEGGVPDDGEIRLWREADWWIAKDVETGVTTQGQSRAAALANLDEAVVLHRGDIGRPDDTAGGLSAFTQGLFRHIIVIDSSQQSTVSKRHLLRITRVSHRPIHAETAVTDRRVVIMGCDCGGVMMPNGNLRAVDTEWRELSIASSPFGRG